MGIQESGEYLDLELVALTEIDMSKLAGDVPLRNKSNRRTVAFFDITNKSDKPWEWEESDLQFVTADKYTIDPELLRVLPTNLPQGWHSVTANIPPSARIKTLISLGEINEEQRIERIIYNVKLAEAWYSALSKDEVVKFSKEYERIELEIPEDSEELDRLPDL